MKVNILHSILNILYNLQKLYDKEWLFVSYYGDINAPVNIIAYLQKWHYWIAYSLLQNTADFSSSDVVKRFSLLSLSADCKLFIA